MKGIRFPIRYKLIVIILIVLFSMIGFSVYNFFSILRHSKDEIKQQNLQIATNIARELDGIINRSHAVLLTLSKHPAVINRDSKECNRLFAELLPSYPLHLNILAGGMDGNNYGSAINSADARKLNYTDKEWFQKACKGIPIVGDLHISKLFKRPAVMIAGPVLGRKGKQFGVIGLPLDITRVRERIKEMWMLPAKSAIDIIDSKGQNLICIYNDTENKTPDSKENCLVKPNFLKNTGSEEAIGPDRIKRLYSFIQMSNAGWTVIVGVPVEKAYIYTYQMTKYYIMMVFVSTIIALMLSMLLSRNITRKIFSLVNGLKEVERGNLNFKLGLLGHDELNDVAESFNRMTAERKKAEELLSQSEQRYRSLVETARDVVFTLSPEGTITSLNPAFEDITGLVRSEWMNKHFAPLIYPDDLPLAMDFFQKTLQGEIPSLFELRILSTSNRYVIAEFTVVPLMQDEKVVSILGIARDITERKKTEELVKNILKSVGEGFIVIDPEYKIILANKAYLDSINMRLEDALGRHCYELSHHIYKPCCEVGLDCPVNLAFKTGESHTAVHTHCDKNGEPIYVETRAYPIKDSSGKVVSAIEIIVDITEKRKLESQLRHAQKMETIGTFAGGIAHDFNNILTAIIGYGNILRMKLREDDPLRIYSDHILDTSDRAVALTQSLLAFSRKQEIKLQPVNLNDIVKRLAKLILRVLGEDIEFSTALERDDLTIMADSGQIEQVLINLCTNARDAMPDGGRLTIKMEVKELDKEFIIMHGYGKHGRYALMTVTDTGVGMDEKTRERIFEPFFTTKEVGKGTGLGLAMVYGIIKQHTGYINCYSEPGKGTTFKIYLPIIAQEAMHEMKPAESAILKGGTETVLIAEDEKEVRGLIKTMLEDFGYKIIEADDGLDALEKFMENQDKIKLVLLDVVMPKMSGKEAYEKIKDVRPDVKVIFTSGYPDDFIRKEKFLESKLNFVSKPIQMPEIIKKVREVLDS